MKTRFPRALALEVARELCDAMRPACVDERLMVAGSLRRLKEEVGDVEIVFVPLHGMAAVPGELLPQWGSLADAVILQLEAKGVLARRKSKTGTVAFGPSNKLMVHVASGVPVDLFATTEARWWNYLVCRTGSAETNTRIAMAARERGAKWHPYSSGFSDRFGDHSMHSEEDVFAFVGLPYLPPHRR